MKGNLPQKNTFGYSILWRYDAGVDPVLHKDYIDSLCEDVRQRISEQIADVAAVRRARQVTRSALETEVLLHWRMAKSKGEECHGSKNFRNSVYWTHLWDLHLIGIFLIIEDIDLLLLEK